MSEPTEVGVRSRLRQLVLRTLLFAVFVVGLVLACRLVNGSEVLESPWLVVFTGALAAALGLVPLVWLEGRDRQASRTRALLVGLAACVLAPLGLGLSVLQLAFTWSVLEQGSPVAALAAVSACAEHLREPDVQDVIAAFGLVLVPVVLGRARRASLPAQVVLALAGALAARSLLWRGEDDWGPNRERLGLVLALWGVGFALVGGAARALERRLARRFGWELARPSAPRARRVRTLALVVAGSVLAVELSGADWPRILDGLGLPWRRAVSGPVPAKLPAGLRLAGRRVPAADGREAELYLWKLPGDAGELELVYVPPGEFVMGSEEGEDNEKPQHVHPMPHGYWIGRTPVTWKQYLAFCGVTGHEKPTRPGYARDDHPVMDVRFADAMAYCTFAGLTLPSEAEWEKAARGTDGRRYPWGNRAPTPTLCNFIWGYGQGAASEFLDVLGTSPSARGTAGTADHPSGASPWGALDMAGNAVQWCDDGCEMSAYARYGPGDLSPPRYRGMVVQRGGCWQLFASFCRSASRMGWKPDGLVPSPGFRVCLRPGP